jgi:hypothetical protein
LPIPGPIVTGSDGKLYFSLNFSGSVGLGNRMASFDPATHKIATYPTPSSLSSPWDINNRLHGSIWFAELTANRLGQLIISWRRSSKLRTHGLGPMTICGLRATSSLRSPRRSARELKPQPIR